MGRIFKLLIITLGLAACGGSSPDYDTSGPPALATRSIPAGMQGKLAKQLFGHKAVASPHRPEPIGFYSKGCLAGAMQLPETGPTWQAMRLSRNRNWGHPETIDLIRKLSAKAAQMPGWNGIYVGDISQPRGGPMLTGHASHQMGMDADIWLRPGIDMNLNRAQRENISAISMRRANGAYTNDNWTRGQHELVKAAAQDPRTARIFLFPGAKVRMCNEEKGDRTYLRKIRPYWGHHYHFHVRLRCPEGAGNCRNQNPPPPGDGCAEAQQWVNNILNPPPPDPNAKPAPPKREARMSDLPGQCVSVLASE